METSSLMRSASRYTNSLVALLPGVALSLAIVVVLASTAAVEQSGDSLVYLTHARDGTRLFHPHHLLFNVAVRFVYLGLDWAASVRDVVLAAQIHNLVYTFVALLAVYWIGLRWLRSQYLGLIGLALYGSTTGMMVFATQAEVYLPAAACLGVTAAFFLALFESPASKISRAGVVIAWVLAVLYHQTAALFVIPMALTTLVARRRELMRAVVLVTAQSGALVLGAYWVAYRAVIVGSRNPASFLDFMFSYAVAGGVRWGSATNFDSSGVLRLLDSNVWGLSARIPDRPGVLIGVAVAGVAGAMVSWFLADPRERLLLFFASSWAVTFLAFFLWWLPEEAEFAVLTSMPLCIAATACVSPVVQGSRIGTTGTRLVIGGTMLIAILNFWGSMRSEVLPRHHTRGEAYQQACFLATFDDGSTLRLTGFLVTMTLRFYFGGSTNSIGVVHQLERSFHVGTSSRAWMVRSKWSRVVVDVSEIQPEAWHSGRDGFREPESWLRMMQWIFNLRGNEDGWYSDTWVIVSNEQGIDYLVVASGRRQLSDPGQLFVQLADEFEPRSHERRAFRMWLKENSELVERTLVRQ